MRPPSALSAIVIAVSCLALEIGDASATQLIWDPLNNGGTKVSGGNWDTTAGNNVWWNGSSDIQGANTPASSNFEMRPVADL